MKFAILSALMLTGAAASADESQALQRYLDIKNMIEKSGGASNFKDDFVEHFKID